MAGELDTGSSLTIVGWILGGVAYGAGLIMYVRQKLKSHDDTLADHKGMITDLQSKHASGVRPQDIERLNERITEHNAATSQKLDFIIKIIEAKQ